MLTAAPLCQQLYYQSIMNLDVSCDAENNGLPRTMQRISILLHPRHCFHGCVTRCFRIYACAACHRESQETPDPEISSGNMRRYPVELSAPPFISIKSCNNACTLSWNCFLPFRVSPAGPRDGGGGRGFVSMQVFHAFLFFSFFSPLYVIVSSQGLWSATMQESY